MSSEPRVLIVESHDAIRAMLSAILRHQPVTVDAVTSTADAYKRITECDFALILIDMDLPGDEGEALIRRFRQERPEAPTFILALRDPRNAQTLDPSLVSAVMNKPIEVDKIADLVRECAAAIPPPEDPLPCPPAEGN